MNTKPKLSVVIPTFDYRIESEFVASWTQGQTCPDSAFEIIVVTHGRDQKMDAEIREVLRPNDQLIYGDHPDENRMFRYNKGFQATTAPFVLFTEDHVIAAADCVEQLIRLSESGEVTCASVTSDNFAKSALGEAEGALSQKFLSLDYHDADWKKVQVRGFMIERNVFNDCGAFPTDFKEFGATALGITLYQNNIKVIVADRARVTHVNHHLLDGLCQDALAYFTGEGEYRAKFSNQHIEKFLGIPTISKRIKRYEKAQAWTEFSLLSKLFFGKPYSKNIRVSIDLIKALTRAILGTKAITLKSWINLQIAKIRWCLNQRNKDQRNRIFEDLWQALAEYGRNRCDIGNADHLSLQTDNQKVSLRSTITMDSICEESLIGFYDQENLDGQAFRWTDSTATIFCSLDETNSSKIRIDFLPLRPGIHNLPMIFSMDGATVANEHVSRTSTSIEIDTFQYQTSTGGLVCLTLAVPSFRFNGDSRSLGLAISGVGVCCDERVADNSKIERFAA